MSFIIFLEPTRNSWYSTISVIDLGLEYRYTQSFRDLLQAVDISYRKTHAFHEGVFLHSWTPLSWIRDTVFRGILVREVGIHFETTVFYRDDLGRRRFRSYVSPRILDMTLTALGFLKGKPVALKRWGTKLPESLYLRPDSLILPLQDSGTLLFEPETPIPVRKRS